MTCSLEGICVRCRLVCLEILVVYRKHVLGTNKWLHGLELRLVQNRLRAHFAIN